MSHPPYLQPHLPTRKLIISHLPLSPICPQEPTGPEVSDPAGPRQWRLPLQLSFQLQRRQSLPTCNCFAFSWWASSVWIGARLRAAKRVHQPHIPLSVCMCTMCIWEWGWCVPPTANPFSTCTHSSAAKRVMLTCKWGGVLAWGTVKMVRGGIFKSFHLSMYKISFHFSSCMYIYIISLFKSHELLVVKF